MREKIMKIKPYVMLLCGATLLFALLYAPFLFGGKIYAYADIGSDTIEQYLPRFYTEVSALTKGRFASYSFLHGLGEYAFSNPSYYLHPVHLPLFLIRSNPGAALLLSLYLKYVSLCLVGFGFFRRLWKEEKAALVSALLWAFSGYAVLWGQHYQFLTNILFFTLFMYGLLRILEGEKRKSLLIACFIPLALFNYLTLYQACLFGGIFTALYLLFHQEKREGIPRKALLFAECLLVSLLVGGIYLSDIGARILGSTRVSNLSSTGGSFLYSIYYYVTFAARFFSSDTLGVGDAFRGATNYYEAAMLSVSTLSLPAFFYLMQTRHRKKVFWTALVSGAALCLPAVSYVLSFRASTQRWTYLLCFAEVIMIGLALQEILLSAKTEEGARTDGKSRAKETSLVKKLWIALLGADAVFGAVTALLFVSARAGLQVDRVSLLLTAACLGLYHCFLLAAQLYRGPRKTFQSGFAVFCVLVLAELFLLNFRSVQERQTVPLEAWEEALYEDGTREVVQEVRSSYGGLYRFNKTYDSVSFNDPLMQGYPGVSAYSSTNSAALIRTYHAFGYETENTETKTGANWVRFSAEDPLENALLGVKYVLARPEDEKNPLYAKAICTLGSALAAYENPYWSGFGALYELDNFPRKLDDLSREAHIEALDHQPVTEIYVEGSVITASVKNDTEKTALLMIPILEDGCWTAFIDGEKTEITAVLGGLTGLFLEPGEHEIKLFYRNSIHEIGLAISLFGLLIYLLLIVLEKKKCA